MKFEQFSSDLTKGKIEPSHERWIRNDLWHRGSDVKVESTEHNIEIAKISLLQIF